MRNYTRFIPGEEIDSVQQWDFGAVDTASLLLAAQDKERSDTVDQANKESLMQEGYAQGYAEGFIQGQAQLRLETQRHISAFVEKQGEDAARVFASLFVNAQAQLDASEQVIAQSVLVLACDLARQVLRQELSANPSVLRPVIREALGLLGVETKSAVVRLSPADLDVLEEPTRAEFAAMSLTMVADASLAPGGCIVESAGMVIDGRLEKRWAQAVATLGLGAAWEVPDDGA